MIRILHGDCRDVLKMLPVASVQCCVTSPPYYGLRDYGVDGQIGLEQSPDTYVTEMVAVFREVRRVLREDGTLWLNLGDSYAAARGGAAMPAQTVHGGGTNGIDNLETRRGKGDGYRPNRDPAAHGLKHKDLMGIPWRVAFALQDDGWYLRSDIIWHKPNPMPESVTDRPTSAHEHVFLLAKSQRYFFDADAVREEGVIAAGTLGAKGSEDRHNTPGVNSRPPEYKVYSGTRNIRNVWTIATKPYSEAHFATMPPELAERCVQAGSRTGDTVLDPFGGAGTTGLVADRLGRDAILIELNPTYADLARNRISDDAGMFASVA